MTRKDFQAIASAIAEVERYIEGTDHEEQGFDVLRLAVDELERVCRASNSRFDGGRFALACLPIREARLKASVLKRLHDERVMADGLERERAQAALTAHLANID